MPLASTMGLAGSPKKPMIIPWLMNRNGQAITIKTDWKGKVGADLTVEEAYEGAKFSALNCLQAIHSLTGSIDNITRIVKVLGMVNGAPGFDNTPGVIHGCSDFLREVFGAAGHHARSAVGMTLPFNFAVEVELVAEVKA